MKEKVLSTIKHSAVYSLGNMALKGMGIITLPIYLNYLTKAEVGTFGLLDITINIIAEVLILGQTNSIIFFENKKEYSNKKSSVFFTITSFVILINLLFILLAELFGFSLLNLSKSTRDLSVYLHFIIYISLLRVLNNLFLNKLRAEEKSIFYTVLTFIKIITFISLIFYTVVYLRLSVAGILYSYLISEIIVLIFILPGIIKKMMPVFDKAVLKEALKFGAPLIFTAIGIMILNLSDRYLINFFLNLEEVGTYDIAYRIAGIVNMFLILPFNQAMLPSAFKEFNNGSNSRYLSKLMTYMCFITLWGGLAISVFGKEIILILGNENYIAANDYIPLIVFAYILSAMRNVASNGLLFAEKTFIVALITILAAILNIILNIFLLPVYGTIAAAYTTLISFAVFYLVTNWWANKYYKIDYENLKIIKLLLSGIVLFVVQEFITINNALITFLLKLIVVAVYPFLLLMIGFYEKVELEIIKEGIKKMKSPSQLIKNLLNK
ncbi:MAG: oligosaccharide flippase family protein [Ignavibacteria bacterium]|nr:oligosaccharide flippase family protein [Ignavibacteria bacterium]